MSAEVTEALTAERPALWVGEAAEPESWAQLQREKLDKQLATGSDPTVEINRGCLDHNTHYDRAGGRAVLNRIFNFFLFCYFTPKFVVYTMLE